MSRKVSRRSMLKTMVGVAGAALLNACAPAAAPTAEPTKASIQATQAPAAGSSSTEAAPAGKEAVTLRVFFGANPEEAKVRQSIFDSFTAANSGIKITPEIPTQNTTEALL